MSDNWYDYPQYYDLLCADETPREVAFITAACEQYCQFPVRRLLEPGCGSGRLVYALTRRGFEVTALDNNQRSLAYLRRKLARAGMKATVISGDMTNFSLPTKVDAAYCLMNTFRHLLTEEAARSHLQSVAKALRVGGIYILGLHLMPWDADDECIERWTAKRGRTKATMTLRVLETNHRQRLEHIRISLLVRSGVKDLRVRTEFALRRYDHRQFRRLLAAVPQFQLVDLFDFGYDIDDPLPFNRDIADAVFILRKQK